MRLAPLMLLLLGAATPDGFSEDFERPVRLGAGPWMLAQQLYGRVERTPAPQRRGHAMLASTSPGHDGTVAKADLVARPALMPSGTHLTVAFDIRIPADSPRNSLQLVDIECATCGEPGNPGVRLYLRHGRLRVDRSKIGIKHAWTRDGAPALAPNRWHRVTWQLRLDAGDSGSSRVLLDGSEVLSATGATLAPLQRIGADRIQIGITANSNPVSARAWFDNIAVAIRR